MNKIHTILGALAVVVGSTAASADRRGVQLDAKDAPLSGLVGLLAAQGGPKLALHPDLEGEKVTFAAKAMPPSAAVRWLCRVCNLIVSESRSGGLVLGRPTIEPAVDKEYVVAKIAPSQEAADTLVSFIKKVVFELHPIRSRGEQGSLEPAFEVAYGKGKLKVCAPPLVQREILALLRAIAKVQPRRGFEDVRVAYQAHEVGFLGPRNPAAAPELLGEVSLSVANVPPAEAAWALTSAAKVSVYVDPWDQGLNATRVTVQAEKRALSDVVEDLARQLGAERCWHDHAWLLVRKDRQPIFDDLTVRAYNTSGGVGAKWGAFHMARELGRAQREASKDLPFTIERADDLLLVSGPAAWHAPVEALLKAAADFGPRRHGPRGRH